MDQHRSDFYPCRNAEAAAREDRREFLRTASITLGLPSFFYASLRDSCLFEAVVGRSMNEAAWEMVVLEGYRLGSANAGTGYPGIFPAGMPHHARVEGVLVHDLTRFEQTMVAWYEWDEYTLQPITLADGRSAQAFVPDLEAIRLEYGTFEIESWSFKDWRACRLDQSISHARAWMVQRPEDAELLESGCCAGIELPTKRRAAG